MNEVNSFRERGSNMSTKEETFKILKELKKRKELKEYESDFELFAEEQLKIITKDSSIGFVPFQFNAAQKNITEQLNKQLAETGRVRAIILKARQQGISTYCAGRVFWKTYFNANTRSVVMAHDSATSDALFDMSKNIITHMEPQYAPTFKKSNAKEIQFEHNDAKYRLYTAGSPEAGRGTTPTIAHLSEVAFWQHDDKILAGLFQGISQAEGTEVILESTANGAAGEFYRLWQGAVAGENEYIPIFLPWYLTPEYYREAPEDFELSVEEEEYKAEYDLSDDQMYWRRLKIGEGGLRKFQQEYPATAEEAFLVSGHNVFDQEAVARIRPIDPICTREYVPTTGGFDEMRQGSLEVWEYPTWDVPYIIAADVAQGVGQDYSVGVVMTQDRHIVAMYRNNRIDPTEFGEALFYLGRYYNNALLCVESNSIGIATIERLRQMQYVNLYYQTKPADRYVYQHEEHTKPGFRTTQASKPAIISLLQEAIREGDIYVPSKVCVNELKTYVSDDNLKMNALDGCHDDTVMSMAMCLEVLRTHADRLVKDTVPWSQKIGQFKPDETEWF